MYAWIVSTSWNCWEVRNGMTMHVQAYREVLSIQTATSTECFLEDYMNNC